MSGAAARSPLAGGRRLERGYSQRTLAGQLVIGLVTAGTLAAMSRCSAQCSLRRRLPRPRPDVYRLRGQLQRCSRRRVEGREPTASAADTLRLSAGERSRSIGAARLVAGRFRARQPLGSGGSALPFVDRGSLRPGLSGRLSSRSPASSSLLPCDGSLAGARFDVRDRWRDAFEAVSRDLRLDQAGPAGAFGRGRSSNRRRLAGADRARPALVLHGAIESTRCAPFSRTSSPTSGGATTWSTPSRRSSKSSSSSIP